MDMRFCQRTVTRPVSPRQALCAAKALELTPTLDLMNGQLEATRAYLAGPAFTLADVTFLPYFALFAAAGLSAALAVRACFSHPPQSQSAACSCRALDCGRARGHEAPSALATSAHARCTSFPALTPAFFLSLPLLLGAAGARQVGSCLPCAARLERLRRDEPSAQPPYARLLRHFLTGTAQQNTLLLV